jgi:hypothetical protein
MNNQFDELTKGLAQSVTRRTALRKFGFGLARRVKGNCYQQQTASKHRLGAGGLEDRLRIGDRNERKNLHA